MKMLVDKCKGDPLEIIEDVILMTTKLNLNLYYPERKKRHADAHTNTVHTHEPLVQ